MSPGISGVRLGVVLLGRLATLAVTWLVLVNGAVSSLWIGVPVIVLALAGAFPGQSSPPVVWREVIRFIPSFLRRSLSGGVDVARRALHPRLPLNPELVEYPLRLPQGLPRVVMADLVNLLPGTLTVELTADELQVHVIDRQVPVLDELKAVERAVARIFGLALDQPGG